MSLKKLQRKLDPKEISYRIQEQEKQLYIKQQKEKQWLIQLNTNAFCST